MSKNKFYITTPIYYVNAKPHIGHTYTTIAADVAARYHRLLGDKTFFLTGTDEHGEKIEKKALEAGKNPQEFVDEVAQQFQIAWQSLNISNDNFLRTTDPNHIKAVQNALQYMFDKGDIYLGKYEALYCVGCEQYKTEKDLVDGLCPDHKIKPELRSEESYMFKMSKYQDMILAAIEKDDLKISPIERKNEVVSFLENEGLTDISFSRKNIKWGIPLPWDESHTAYVWADAFLNYLTGLGWTGGPPLTKGVGGISDFWPVDLQLMSKDILRVHATIWQAMLLSLDLPLTKEIFVHGFFLIDGQKMSKSIGNVVAPEDLIARYGVDATRYLLMSATTFGRDGDVGWKFFDEKYTADLANGLGNLVARVSNLLEKNEIKLGLSVKDEKSFGCSFCDDKSCVTYNNLMQKYQFDEVLKLLWSRIKQCDESLTQTTPWKMTDKDEIKKVLEPIAQTILTITERLQPFMPTTSETIINQFTSEQIKKGDSLFPRIS